MSHAMTVSPEAMAYFQNLKEKGEIQGEWLKNLTVVDLDTPENAHPLKTAEVAALAQVTEDWVRKLAPEMPGEVARKVGGEWRYTDAAARWIGDRPDGRGRKPKKAWLDSLTGQDFPWQNPIDAVLSADLPIDVCQAVEDFIADRGREQWAEDIAQGIAQAGHISARHFGQLLDCENVIRWNRAVEALAKRPELTPEHAERLIKIAPDDRMVARSLAQKAASAHDWPRELIKRLGEHARKLDKEWYDEAK